MRTFLKLAVGCALACSAQLRAKDVVPEPSPEPDYAQVRVTTEQRLMAKMIDPDSTQIRWTNGFQWTSIKPLFGARVWGWIGCGTYNSRNRMGGYAGQTAFFVVWDGGFKVGGADENGSGFASKTCRNLPSVPLPKALSQAPALPFQGSVADELAKLAKLRQDGIITSAEFEAQKAKLLGN